MLSLLIFAAITISSQAVKRNGKIILAHPKHLSGVGPIFAGVEVNTHTDRVIITLKGPWEYWYGVGFGNNMMEDTYAIIVEGDDGDVQERRLEYEGPGKALKPSDNTYIINDETIFINNKPVRLIQIETDIDNEYFRFPTKSGSRLDVIYGLGAEKEFKSKHFEKGVEFLELYDIYDQPPQFTPINDVLDRVELIDDEFGIEVYYDFTEQRNKAIYIQNGNMPRSVVVESYNNDITISYISTGYVKNINVIFALIDTDNDNHIDYDILLWKSHLDFVIGNGVNLAIDNTDNKNTLYVVNHVGIYKCMDNINQYILDSINNGDVDTLNDDPLLKKEDCPLFLSIPYSGNAYHQQNYMKVNPNNGQLCFAMGVQCNICEHPEWESALHCIQDMDDPEFTDDNIVAIGIRNCIGFAFHPIDNKLWFSDNGRDLIGNDIPDGELNVISFKGEHFGFPYCFTDGRMCGDPHNRDGGCGGEYLFDPDFNPDGVNSAGIDCEMDTTLPLQVTGPHSAPLGMIFYEGDMFPAKYKNSIFLAIHGSWDRDEPLGYTLDVAFLNDDIDDIIDYDRFAKGWLDQSDGNYYGRPVDMDTLPDGSLLLTDDFRKVIYRIYYGEENKTKKLDSYRRKSYASKSRSKSKSSSKSSESRTSDSTSTYRSSSSTSRSSSKSDDSRSPPRKYRRNGRPITIKPKSSG